MANAWQAFGGTGDNDEWDAGCGTVYAHCGTVTNALFLDNADRDASPLPTLLMDEGVTSYDFDTVKLVGTTALGFAPRNAGASTVTVSIRTGAGDRSSTLLARPTTDMVESTVLILTGDPNGAFVYDSHFQPTSGSLQAGTSGAEWHAHWSREYMLSGSNLLSQMSVSVSAGSELIAPLSLAVEGVSLTLNGKLTGVAVLSLGDGATATFGSTGSCNSSSAGVYSLSQLLVDGRASDSAAPTAKLVMEHEVTLVAETATVSHGMLDIAGAVGINATLLNMTAEGTIDGKGGSHHTAAYSGPGGATTNDHGCTFHGDGRYRGGSHGGRAGWGTSGGTGERCAHGSTFFPSEAGSASNNAVGGAAVKVVATEMIFDGTIDVRGNDGGTDGSGASGGSVWITAGVLRGSGGVIEASGGNVGWRHGTAGGGGGRIALYCTTSEYSGVDSRHGWELPAMQAIRLRGKGAGLGGVGEASEGGGQWGMALDRSMTSMRSV